jgi:hypothetical protein
LDMLNAIEVLEYHRRINEGIWTSIDSLKQENGLSLKFIAISPYHIQVVWMVAKLVLASW